MASDRLEDVQHPQADSREGTMKALQDRDDSSTCSANGSVRTVSTATYEREEQEAEEIFRQRIEKLCRVLWPPKSIKDRLVNSEVANHLRANMFFGSLVPVPQTPLIERLRDGDLNHITSITLPSSYGHGDRKLILRVPRWDQKRLDRNVAILNYVRWKTSIPVPTIAATDFSCDNVLQKPYVLQHRIPGKDLNTVWDDLSHLQRCTVAGELGRVIRTLLLLEHPTTGIIEAAPRSKGGVDCFSIVPYELDLGEGEEEPKAETYISLTAFRPVESTLDSFRSQFGRWRTLALKRSCGEIDNEIQLWDCMLRAVLEMEGLGLFRPNLNCLCHVDLHSGNIMVETQSDMSIRLTAILDWDEAIFAPKFVNCKPPAWLWDDDYEDLLDEDDLDPWPYELDGANALPSSREKQELKRIFEENAGPEYPHLAYDEHSRLCRGLFRIAKDGLNDNANWKAAERILSEWEILRHSLTSEF
ncbi:hypothetical protein N7G274_006025 [Stereocaulon virgatum]|uniref:Aminoglycoside phosphotransferase domain-containing protein n=1 Tax=Stereocaulon virgatum TaxID=373712 RepID=A0ABR4A6S0_9LECA